MLPHISLDTLSLPALSTQIIPLPESELVHEFGIVCKVRIMRVNVNKRKIRFSIGERQVDRILLMEKMWRM